MGQACSARKLSTRSMDMGGEENDEKKVCGLGIKWEESRVAWSRELRGVV